MDNLMLICFGIFLLALIVLDIVMIISLLKPGDERKQLIVWKASAFTLLVAVFGLVIDIIEAIVKVEAMVINPFIKLSVIAMIYCISLLAFKKSMVIDDEKHNQGKKKRTRIITRRISKKMRGFQTNS